MENQDDFVCEQFSILLPVETINRLNLYVEKWNGKKSDYIKDGFVAVAINTLLDEMDS